MKKGIRTLLIATLSTVVVSLTGCGENMVPVERELDSIDLSQGTILEQEHDIEGIHFVNTYDTGRYDLSNWRITDSKTLTMTVEAQNIPEGTEVIIEHMHVTVSLKAEYAQVDGMKQAEMDDTFHGYGQDGFVITNEYPYINIFAIDGYSETLLSGWGYYTSSTGSCTVDEIRLTENNLLKYHKVYGNKIQVVYDVMIKNAGESYFHTVPMKDEFLITVKQLEELKQNE